MNGKPNLFDFSYHIDNTIDIADPHVIESNLSDGICSIDNLLVNTSNSKSIDYFAESTAN